MDTNYLTAIEVIQNTRTNLEDILIKADEKSFENERAYILIENLLSEFEMVMDTIYHYSKPYKEGYLTENSNGIFEIEYVNGGINHPLNCGNNIEIFISSAGWEAGRIEITPRDNIGYYFYNEKSENHALYNGMKVRFRINDLVR
jgi:hypothetical protein